MGRVNRSQRFRVTDGRNTVDPRLMDTLTTAASAVGYDVQFVSGVAARSAGTKNHILGYATDVQLIDQQTGEALPNYQNGPSFAAYEQFAQAARVVQTEKYPELNRQFRWGGYFGSKSGAKGYGAVDLMHFDISPWMSGAMGMGSWDGGAHPELLKAYPGAVSNGGLGGLNGARISAGIRGALEGISLLPPATIPSGLRSPVPAPYPAFRASEPGPTYDSINSPSTWGQFQIDMVRPIAAPAPLTPASMQVAAETFGDTGGKPWWSGLDANAHTLPPVDTGSPVPPQQVPGENVNGGIDYNSDPQPPRTVQLLASAQPGTPENGFNTVLSPDDEKRFQQWKEVWAPHDDGSDYDLRGAYAAGVTPAQSTDPASNGHWPDTFKKPNEPTFSTFSQYAKYLPAAAGHWDGDTYIPGSLATLNDVHDARETAALAAQKGSVRAPVPAEAVPPAPPADTAKTIKIGKHVYKIGDKFDQGGFHYVVTEHGIDKAKIASGEPTLLNSIVKAVVTSKIKEAAPGVKQAVVGAVDNVKSSDIGGMGKGLIELAKPLGRPLSAMGAAIGQMFGHPLPADGYTTEDGGTRNGRPVVIVDGSLNTVRLPTPVPAQNYATRALTLYTTLSTPGGAVLPKDLMSVLGGTPYAAVSASVDTHFTSSPDAVTTEAETRREQTLARNAPTPAPKPAPVTGSLVRPNTVTVKPDGSTSPNGARAGTVPLPGDVVPRVGNKGGYSTIGVGPGTFDDFGKTTVPTAKQAGNPPSVQPQAHVIKEAARQKVVDMVANPAYATWERQQREASTTKLNDIHDARDTATMNAQRPAPVVTPPPPKTIAKERPVTAPAPSSSSSAGTGKQSVQAGGYVIQKGDTLSAIAKRNGTTVAELQRANDIVDANKIRAGATLAIPASSGGGGSGGGGSGGGGGGNSGAAPVYVDKTTGKQLTAYTINSFNNETLRFEQRTGYH